MKREYIKTGLIVLLLLIVLALGFILYLAAKKLHSQDEELRAATEANDALQSEIDHYEENAAKKEITSVLGEEPPTADPPQLGGSLHFKVQVLQSHPGQFEAWLTGKRYRIRLTWDRLEKRWIMYRVGPDQLTVNPADDYQTVKCAFDDSTTLNREIISFINPKEPGV